VPGPGLRKVGAEPADLDSPGLLSGFFAAIQTLSAAGLVLAYHDRSDGGLFVTLLEMAFAGGTGVDVDITGLPGADESPLPVLFNEELGAVVQVRAADVERATALFAQQGWPALSFASARPAAGDRVLFRRGDETLFAESRARLRGIWSEDDHALQALRDDPACADEEQAARVDAGRPGLDRGADLRR